MKVEFTMKNGSVKTYIICTLTKEQLKEALKTQEVIEFRTPEGTDISIKRDRIDIAEIIERGGY